MKFLPEGSVSDAVFEGANIVLYSKDKDFLFNNNDVIRRIVEDIKKRVELRPDPSLCLDPEKAKEQIIQMLPQEAGVNEVLFDPQRSRVIIEAEKPGIAIGKQGENLRAIKQQTFWVPHVRRTPAIKSSIIDGIRRVLYENSDYRRKFLHKVGQRVYDGWIRDKKHEWVRLTYLGSGRQVGRSCLFLQTPESRVLLDAGIDPAKNIDNSEMFPYMEAPEFKIDELDAIIISHAHLDHVGFLPCLFKYGYKGPVYCTPPTRDVMSLLQLDFVKIMKHEGKDPLYTSEEIKEVVKHTITVNYEEVTDITPDIRMTFYNAGHILGSAMVHLHVGNGLHNMLYTADLKFGNTMLLDPAVHMFPRLETMMIESTYGGRDNLQPTREESEEDMSKIIKEAIDRKGKVLVPVLGVGRAQEVMLIIEQMIRTGMIERVPVFVDGMVWDVTAIHTAYPEYLNMRVRKQIFHKDHNPFLSDIFKRVGSVKERKEVIEETGSCVIVATSGMLVGGASVEYFTQLCDNPRNTIIFVSYQGEGSLGRRVQRGEKELINPHNPKEVLQVKMQIETVEGFSGHSSRKQLMSFVHKCLPRPRKIIFNHGEATRCLDFASSIYKMNHIETVVPRNLETVRIV